jgi:DMSO/TMAO reductase YedYZ heme-binding membrane subunit
VRPIMAVNRLAFCLLWCFVFVIPWEEVVGLPLWGSIPRLVGLVALAVGVLHILARRRIRRPLGFTCWRECSCSGQE